jgi:hypothetical protein
VSPESKTADPARQTVNPPPDHDTPMTATYVSVLVLEAAVLALLWLFGHAFS